MTPLPDTFKDRLKKQFGPRVRFNEPMRGHTSLRTGGPAEVWVEPDHPEELKEIFQECRYNHFNFMVIGGGTNLLVKDTGIKGVVVSLKKCFNQIRMLEQDRSGILVEIGAGVKTPVLLGWAAQNSLKGLSGLAGIPGTVGGAVMMNAGAGPSTRSGAAGDCLYEIDILSSDGRTMTIKREDMRFGYRFFAFKGMAAPQEGNAEKKESAAGILLNARFLLTPGDAAQIKAENRELLTARKKSQPSGRGSAGCFFKNPAPDYETGYETDYKTGHGIENKNSCKNGKSAGRLIDLAGLKGKRIGGAEVSALHANFIINRGSATSADFLALIDVIRNTVFRTFHITLETEVKVIG